MPLYKKVMKIMKNYKSSLLDYIAYKYLFGCMIVLMLLGASEKFIQDGLTFDNVNIKDSQGLLTFVAVFSAFQLIAFRFVFRATVNKEEIQLNGKSIKWDNVKYINRLYHIYILKTKDTKRFYLFPTEKQSDLLFGERIKDTDMDQIINLKTAG